MLRALLLATLCWASPARATSVVRVDVVEQAWDSTAVVDARVLDAVEVVDPDGRQYTHTALAVDRVLAGKAPGSLEVRQIKGIRADGARFFVIGDGELVPGERVVAFLRLHPDGRWYLTALAQSVWHVADRGADPVVERSFDGLTLYDRTVRGVVPSETSEIPYETLSELERAVTGLRCAEGR